MTITALPNLSIGLSGISIGSKDGNCSPCLDKGTAHQEANAPGPNAGNTQELTEEEKQQVEKLKKIDKEVRAHEMAHVAAGGGVVRGGPNYQYTTGPDGNSYATSGHVSIDASPVADDPKATISKMQKVKRAALAPANPSGQDLKVAAQATATSEAARADLIEEQKEKNQENQSRTPGSYNHYDVQGALIPTHDHAAVGENLDVVG